MLSPNESVSESIDSSFAINRNNFIKPHFPSGQRTYCHHKAHNIKMSKLLHQDIQHLIKSFANLAKPLAHSLAKEGGFPISVTNAEIQHALPMLNNVATNATKKQLAFRHYNIIPAYDAIPIVMIRLISSILGLQYDQQMPNVNFRFSRNFPETTSILADIIKPLKSINITVENNPQLLSSKNPYPPHWSLKKSDLDSTLLYLSGSQKISNLSESFSISGIYSRVIYSGPTGLQPTFVFNHASIDQVSKYIVTRAFPNGGQYCMSTRIVYIESPLFKILKKQIVDLTKQVRVGDPFDSSTQIGPFPIESKRKAFTDSTTEMMSSQYPIHKLLGHVNGEFIYPHVYQCDEVIDTSEFPFSPFGPILILVPFDNREKILKIINSFRPPLVSSAFGLYPAFSAQSQLIIHNLKNRFTNSLFEPKPWFHSDNDWLTGSSFSNHFVAGRNGVINYQPFKLSDALINNDKF